MSSIWFTGKFPLIGLSPMDGITDFAFRSTQAHIAKPDVIFTEFVSAEGLVHGGVKLFDLLLYKSDQRPIIGQLFGKDPASFYGAALILCYLGFDGIDLNFGCPARTVTQHGGGAALIGKPALASEIIKAAKQAIVDWSLGKSNLSQLNLNQKTVSIINRNLEFSGHIPAPYLPSFSIKTRLGIDSDISSQWIPFLADHRPDFITLHGRTLKQAYAGLADWEAIARSTVLSRNLGVPLMGNGDVKSLTQARQYIDQYQVDGVLIGRASLGNPWVFSHQQPTWKDKFSALVYQLNQFRLAWPQRRLDPLRRHFLEYTKGHPHAKSLRLKIINLSAESDLLSLEPDFLAC